jgi:hypothetical protein
MATIPSGQKILTSAPEVNTNYGGPASLQALNTWYTMEDISNTVKPYKVYTALLTQKGANAPGVLSNSDLTIGVTYQIKTGSSGSFDFTNVGAPNNDINTYFVATGTTPNDWGSAFLNYNEGAPVVTVLENTIGNVWFTYNGDGDYLVNSDNLFIDNKTFSIIGTGFENIVNNNVTGLVYSGPTQLFLQTGLISTVPVILANDILLNTPIEIRVYN